MVLTLLRVPAQDPVPALKEMRQGGQFVAREVFFRAMRDGYASGVEKGTITEVPGSKTIRLLYQTWELLDLYVVTPTGEWSGGTTHIFYKGVPVWMMQYMGWYRKEAIPCLKAALSEAYSTFQFFGGRGPEKKYFLHPETGEMWEYINRETPIPRGNWRNFGHTFAGIETILAPDGSSAGFHTYQGMWMVQ